MRRVLVVTIAAAAILALAWFLAGLPGTVAINLSGYSISFATSLALVALAVALTVVLLVIRLVAYVLRTPSRFSFWRRRRRRAGGDDAITRTLVALAAGVEDEARREAARARKLLGDTPQTLLLAAEAGRLGKREDEAAALYNLLADREDGALLGLRGLFRQALNREAWTEAAAIAARAEKAHPGGSWLREEREQLAVRTGNWPLALRLSEAGAPREAFAVAVVNAEPDADEALRLARRTWKTNPGFAPAALAYARRLRKAGRDARAQGTIHEAWSINPHPELAAFLLDAIEDPHEREREAGRLVASNIDHPECRLLLARVALAAGQIRDARYHLNAAQRAGLDQKRLWLLWADLEMQEHGDTEAGQTAQREALRRATLASPDPAWRCDNCGAEHVHWLAACPACHAAGRINWSVRQVAVAALEG